MTVYTGASPTPALVFGQTDLSSPSGDNDIGMALGDEIPSYSKDDYDIRPAASNGETRQIWWPFMQGLGWVH